MPSKNHQKSNTRSPVFKVSVICMVILGFSQLVAIGAAFVARQGKVHTVEVIKYKDPIIIEKQPDKQAKVAPIGKARSAEEILADMSSDSEDLDITSSRTSSTSVDTSANTAPSLPLNQRQSSSYFIEHPRVEELLNRAHRHFVRGDMVNSILQAQEALSIDPDEPAIYDQLAQISEEMSMWKKAENYYLKIHSMGIVKGSIFYSRAAKKLEKGVRPRATKDTLLTLSHPHISKETDQKSARVVIPIHVIPGETVVSDHVSVTVHFYDQTNGKDIKLAAETSIIKNQWLNKQPNWNVNEQESLECSYQIPSMDKIQRHLFGERKFFGVVIELHYKGKIQDQVAVPRMLNYIHSQNKDHKEEEFDQMNLLDDINSSYPLLPNINLDPNMNEDVDINLDNSLPTR